MITSSRRYVPSRRPGNLPTPLTSFVGRGQDIAELSSAPWGLAADHAGGRRRHGQDPPGPGGGRRRRRSSSPTASGSSSWPPCAPARRWTTPSPPPSAWSPGVTCTRRQARSSASPPGRRSWSSTTASTCWTRRAICEDALVHCTGVVGLATSREPLRVPGERVWPVGPLDVDSEAVELFADRAAAVRRGFALTDTVRPVVAQICRRLDGMPLAIELAAARLRSMTPAEMADRLDERFRLLRTGRPRPRPQPPCHPRRRRRLELRPPLVDEQRCCAAGGVRRRIRPRAAHRVCSDATDEFADPRPPRRARRALARPPRRPRRATRYRILRRYASTPPADSTQATPIASGAATRSTSRRSCAAPRPTPRLAATRVRQPPCGGRLRGRP